MNLANGWPASGDTTQATNPWHQWAYYPGPWAAFAGFGAGLQTDAFKFSGMGSRAGILAFIRKQGVLINCAEPACLIDERLAAVR